MNQQQAIKSLNRYGRIIEAIFLQRFKSGMREVEFGREDLERTAADLGIKLPKNLGDVIYSFRYRVSLPQAFRPRRPKAIRGSSDPKAARSTLSWQCRFGI